MDNSRSMNAEIVARLEESFVVPHLRELIDEQDKLGETREKLLELHKDLVEALKKGSDASDRAFYAMGLQMLHFVEAIQSAANGEREALEREIAHAAQQPYDIAAMRARLRQKVDHEVIEAEILERARRIQNEEEPQE